MKEVVLSGVISFLMMSQVNAFTTHRVLASDTIYSFTSVDKSPEPETGMPDLYKMWNRHARYPAQARRKGVEGKVFLYLIVDKNGVVTESGIQDGIGYGCNEAALDAFKKLTLKWKPGIKNGKNVKVRLILPFLFKLN